MLRGVIVLIHEVGANTCNVLQKRRVCVTGGGYIIEGQDI